ncbi:hypothetical protein [Escherichia coli]|uniref:hypothetical protein n=1 Tax=Escherichia coli TaxID=562 RepID=UPI00287A0181|nr:hypothetical protein [Escherichia coli]MDS1617170.1 hypothetical protein [Escherichia coli]
MALPERAYYSLKKAAEKINDDCGCNLDVQDILHYGAIGELELCVFISGDSSEYQEETLAERAEVSSGFVDYAGFRVSSFMDFAKLADDEIYRGDDGDMVFRSYICDYFDFRQSFCFSTQEEISFSFEGVFAIGTHNLRKCELHYMKGNEVLVEANLFFVANGIIDENEIFYPLEIRFPVVLSFGVNELLITDVELNRFKGKVNGKGENFSNSSTYKGMNVNRAQRPLHTSKKTEHSQARFIKSMIEAVLGKQVAANPRWHMDNEKGQLHNLFKDKGIKPVSGKALEGWIRDVDVEYRG